MKKSIIFIMLITILFIVNGCSEDSDTEIIEHEWLDVGSYWDYEIIYEDNGNPVTRNERIQIESLSLDESMLIYNLNADPDEVFNYRWKEEGFYEHWGVPGSCGGWYNRLFKYPVSEGEVWELYADWGPFNIRCLNDDLSITLPAGDFSNVIVYEVERDLNDSRYGYVWFHPEYGIIKEAHGYNPDSLYYHKTLVDCFFNE